MTSYLQWLQFPFLRYLLFFISGILLQDGVPIKPFNLLYIAVFFFLLFMVLSFLSRSHILIGLTGCIFFLVTGLTAKYGSRVNSEPGEFTQNINGYYGEVESYKGSTGRNHKYTFQVLNTIPVIEDEDIKIVLYSSDTAKYQTGTQLFITGRWEVVERPKNPYQFNYREYLNSQGISGVHFAGKGDIQMVGMNKPGLFGSAIQLLRDYSTSVLRQSIISDREYGVASALLIGNRQELERETKARYSETGAMHILAVSGLHVGILFIALGRVLRYLPITEFLRNVFILGAIWLFAGLTGFSPSVVRASLMFTALLMAPLLKRQSSIYNTIAFTAFAMLLVNPSALWDIGFQLSFLAVTGIVFLQQRIYKWLYFKNRWFNWIWELTSVGLAAQIATFPLGLYYFKQFPTYFFLTNLIAVPLALVIVNLGLILLLTYVIGLMGWLGRAMEFILWLLNEVVIFISSLPGATIQIRSMTLGQVICIYFVIITFILFLEARKINWLILCFLGSLLLSFYTYKHFRYLNKPRIVLYSLKQGTCVDYYINNQRNTYEKDVNENDRNYLIEPARRVFGDNYNKPLGVVSGKMFNRPDSAIVIELH